MADNTKLLKELQDELENGKLPTAPVGENVVYFKEGKLDQPMAAVCTRVEGPGRISVTIFGLQSHPAFAMGVMHVSSKEAQQANGQMTRRNGTWAYVRELYPISPAGVPIPTDKPVNAVGAPTGDYDIHARDITRRRQLALQDHVPPGTQPKPATSAAAT